MAEMILGHPVSQSFTKRELIELMRYKGLLCYAGMDFGYSHNFAVVTFFVDGYRAFVVDVIAEPELLPDQQVQVCTARIKEWEPTIFADPENRQMRDTFRKSGFRMREWQKQAGSVVGGINLVHLRLRPPMSEPLMFFLGGDPGVDLLCRRLSKYHWVQDQAGRITDRPSDEEDDECDALRYGIMNVFAADKGRVLAVGGGTSDLKQEEVQGYTVESWMSKVIEESGGHSEGSTGSQGRRGRFKWSI